MANVTYLFGAGASAKALPVVRAIPEALKALINRIESDGLNVRPSSNEELITAHTKGTELLLKDLKWLLENSNRHSTIDTFAKKLTIIKNEADLTRLKNILSAFLSYYEYLKPVDIRYDSFFASIINSTGELPSSVKVVSWNYDRQFEKGYMEYMRDSTNNKYQLAREYLNFKTPNNYNREDLKTQKKQFEIIKLNGSIVKLQYDKDPASFPEEEDLILESSSDYLLHEILAIAYYKFGTIRNLNYPSLRFAWEKPKYLTTAQRNTSFTDTISASIADTDVLVIIGYSFPFFNREVDKKILNDALNKKIRKIYIQDLYPEDIKTKLIATFPITAQNIFEIVPLTVKPDEPSEEFYLPPELTL